MSTGGFSITEKNGIKLISVDCINNTGMFKAFYSTGYGGVSNMPGNHTMNLNIFKVCQNDTVENAKKNMELFSNVCGFNTAYLVAQHEVHSNTVRTVTSKDFKPDIFDVALYEDGDGQVTADKSVALFVYASDCATLMLADPVSGIFATTHCGWKNSLNSTIKNWITEFVRLGGNPSSAIVAVGPSLCKSCFEVDSDVANIFIDAGFEKNVDRPQGSDRKWHIDLPEINKQLLIGLGVRNENIYLSPYCNRCSDDMGLPSFRRDKALNGVMGGIIFRTD